MTVKSADTSASAVKYDGFIMSLSLFSEKSISCAVSWLRDVIPIGRVLSAAVLSCKLADVMVVWSHATESCDLLVPSIPYPGAGALEPAA